MYTDFQLSNLNNGFHWDDLEIDSVMILKWILNKRNWGCGLDFVVQHIEQYREVPKYGGKYRQYAVQVLVFDEHPAAWSIIVKVWLKFSSRVVLIERNIWEQLNSSYYSGKYMHHILLT
jgi:hypothetical protein